MKRSLSAIGNIFSEIQDAGSVNNKMIYSLIEEFVANPNHFLRGMEQCYLKICKGCSRAHKKQLEKFEKITEKFFQIFLQEAKSSSDERTKIAEDDVYGVLQHLLNFLCEGLEAPNIIVRQICAKHISIMLKVFAKDDFETVLDQKVINNLNQGNVSLLRSKQPSLKLLGLKIASYIQDFESDEVQQEVVNLVANEEGRDIRKVAIVNLRINENTLPALLSRTRDIDSELRILVYKKLIKHKVHLINLKLTETYKIVYDGLFAREEGVREQCAAYLREVYYMFEPSGDGNASANKTVDKAEESRQIYLKVKTAISRFLKIFQIQKALTHPQIYELIETIIIQAIKVTIQLEKLEIYVQEFLRLDLKQQKLFNSHPEEIFFIRVVCQYVTKHPLEFPSLSALIDDSFPSLAEFSKVIDKFFGKRDLLSTYQVILLAELLLNSDETGRQALITSLRSILLDANTKLEIIDEDGAQEDHNDVFPEKTEKMILLECYSQSFLDTPIVQNVDDLVPIIVRILRKLLDDKNNAFSTLLLETISIIREPFEKSQELERNELLEERQRLLKHIEYYDDALKEFDDKIQQQKNLKRNKQQQGLDVLEKEKANLEQERAPYLTKLNEIDSKTSSINIRCLNIACSLLEGCKLSLTDPGIMGLLGSFIGPCFQEANSRVKDLSFKCLSLYLLLDKRTCTDYMKVYKNLIDEHYERNESVPSLLTAIKACFDFFLIFKFAIEEEITFDNDDDEHFEAQDVLESLTALMYNGDINTKKICVEGFCKLLFNNKVKNPTHLLSLLMLIWVNPSQTLNEGTKIIQILSMFYKAYTPYSYSCLKNSELAIEILMELLSHVSESRDLEFYKELSTSELSEDFFSMILRTALSLMKKDEYKFSDADAEEEKISPLERFFIFLLLFSAEKEKTGKPYRKIFVKSLNQFEFEKLPTFNKLFLKRFISELAEDKDGVSFKDYLKRIKVQDEDSKQVDEEELNALDKKLVEDIKKSRLEAKHLVKYLLAYKVLVKKDPKKMQNPDIIEIDMSYLKSDNKSKKQDTLKLAETFEDEVDADDASISKEKDEGVKRKKNGKGNRGRGNKRRGVKRSRKPKEKAKDISEQSYEDSLDADEKEKDNQKEHEKSDNKMQGMSEEDSAQNDLKKQDKNELPGSSKKKRSVKKNTQKRSNASKTGKETSTKKTPRKSKSKVSVAKVNELVEEKNQDNEKNESKHSPKKIKTSETKKTRKRKEISKNSESSADKADSASDDYESEDLDEIEFEFDENNSDNDDDKDDKDDKGDKDDKDDDEDDDDDDDGDDIVKRPAKRLKKTDSTSKKKK